jgi:hypothetical protein
MEDKISLIFSDIEIGDGGPTDDFEEEDLLCETIRRNFIHMKEHPVDLILNGDIFDFMKAPYKGKYPRHITEKVSIWKLNAIYKAHKQLFKTWKDFLLESKNSRLVFIFGNHDYDLVFEGVRNRLTELIVGQDEKLKKRVLFPGWEFEDGLLLVEHGSQLDRFFSIDPDSFILHGEKHKVGDPFLQLPWGYNALYEFYIFIKEEYPIIERLFPRSRVVVTLPDRLRYKLIFGTLWHLAKSFFYTQWRHWDDVLYRFHWRDFISYLRNFVRNEYDLHIIIEARRKLKKSKFEVLAVGHNHIPKLRKCGRKKIMNTGPWRDEYQFSLSTGHFEPKDKSYGFIIHNKKEVKQIQLVTIPSRMKPITVDQINNLGNKKSKSK